MRTSTRLVMLLAMETRVQSVRDLPLANLGGAGMARAIAFQLEIQDGMITRRQLAGLGASPGDVARMLRRRELVRVAPGVYADHTGRLSWIQTAWREVMRLWPAALSHESVWRQTPILHVAVDESRRVTAPHGVLLHRRSGLDAMVRWSAAPPRIRAEHAALDAAAAAHDVTAAVALLSDVVQRRLASYPSLLKTIEERTKLPRRRLVHALLLDLSTGSNSVLEHAYFVDVERPHGLPSAERQFVSHAGGKRAEHDVRYPLYGLIVELDGRTFHDNAAARDRDLERDLNAAVADHGRTIRLGYGQVTRNSCATAAKIGLLLQKGGWTGSLKRCERCPGQ